MEGNAGSVPEGRQEFSGPAVFMLQPTRWEVVPPEDEPKWIAKMEELTGLSFGPGEGDLRGNKTYCYSDWYGHDLADDCDWI